MTQFAADYTTDFGEFLPLREMRVRQLGEVTEEDELILIPQIIRSRYKEVQNENACPFVSILARYVEITSELRVIRYIIPFEPSSPQWLLMLEQLANYPFGTTWKIQGERASKPEIDLALSRQ